MTRVLLVLAALLPLAGRALADGNLQNVHHVVILMQENHSFDNYFGALPYVAGSPYHTARGSGPKRACAAADHTCVDGLRCKMRKGNLLCANSNPSPAHHAIRSFHDPRYCTVLDLDHGWEASHK